MYLKLKKYFLKKKAKENKDRKEEEFYSKLIKKYNIKPNKSIFLKKLGIFLLDFSSFISIMITFFIVLILSIYHFLFFNSSNVEKEYLNKIEPVSYKNNIHEQFNNIYNHSNEISYEEYLAISDLESEHLEEEKNKFNFYYLKDNNKTLSLVTTKNNEIFKYNYKNQHFNIDKNVKNIHKVHQNYKGNGFHVENYNSDENSNNFVIFKLDIKPKENLIINPFLLHYQNLKVEKKDIEIDEEGYSEIYYNSNVLNYTPLTKEEEKIYQKDKTFLYNLFYFYLFSIFITMIRFFMPFKYRNISKLNKKNRKYIIEQANKKEIINLKPFGKEKEIIKAKNIISL